MGRFNFMDPAIQSRSGLPLCGLAVTVNARPADNLMIHKALAVATPGDIVVVSTGGNTTSAVFGELMCTTATAARLGGIVVDGAIRDVERITALGFPAYSRSVSPGSCDIAIDATVAGIESTGSMTFIVFELAAQPVIVAHSGRPESSKGDKIRLHISSNNIHLFDRETELSV